MEKFAQVILKFRWIIIIVVIMLTAFLAYQIKSLNINSDIISSLPDDDPDALLFKKIGEQFGGFEMGMIILETENIFQGEVLEHIRQITDSLKMTDGISSVTSLTSIIDIRGGEYGIEIGELVDEYDLPDTPEELINLRDRVLSKEMYRGVIVSEDETATLIIFTLPDDADAKDVATKVKEKVNSLDLPENIYFSGSPMMVTYIAELISDDLKRLIPLAFLLISFILFLGFRTIRGVLLPLLTAVIAIIWTLGIMSLSGYKVSMISNNIPIILLAIGSAYTIHVLNRINQCKEKDREKALRLALSYIIVPVILAALTTIIGFISFVFGAYLSMIRDFGIFTALGTFFTAILSIFFVPAIISALYRNAKDPAKQDKKYRKSILSNNVLAPLKKLLFLHPKYILFTWSILILLSIGGTFMIKRSVNIQEYFRKGNPTRIAEEIMTEKFGGSKPIFVLFKGDMQSPAVLQTMIKTEKYMKESPDITSTQSIADLIKEIMYVIGEGKTIPDEKDKIEQLWFLLEGNDIMSKFVNEDLSEGIILSKFVSPDNEAKKEFSDYMNKFIEENSTEDCLIEITGMPFVDVTMDRSLLYSQLGSLSIAIIFVIIIVGLILGSFKSGMYSTIPIVASIIILFGFMGVAGISLNIATVLVASVALGIGIDYSIHIISHFNDSFNKTGDIQKALEDIIMISGKAILINVSSVAVGFLVLLFSEMVPLQYFGLLIALSMVGSSLGALTLLPVILILVNRKRQVVN
ncbi:MAG: MMPL family transporter [Bacteroidales bacterium]|nr:MMPL family transporter [Bacteroidales bacterium]